MKLISIRDKVIFGLAILVLGMPGISRADGDFSKIYFFGDSLSDTGNVYLATGLIARPPYDIVPSAPYAIGGHQFSNGTTWAQVFARNKKLGDSGKAALQAPGTNGNFAFGGARARGSGSLIPSASDQVSIFTSIYGAADPNALYVIQFGGNDLRDALEALRDDPSGVTTFGILGDAVTSIGDNIISLHSIGAQQFLVANAPNLARTPAVILSGPDAVGAANLFGSLMNLGLESALSSLESLPNITINRIDFFGLLDQIASSPENFGVSITDVPCLSFGVLRKNHCSNPGEYLFWDGIHPTAVIHKAIGDFATSMFDGG